MGALDALLEAIAPTRCAGCDLPGTLLCATCDSDLPLLDHAHACPRCAAPHGWIVCTECWDSELALDGATGLGTLERPLSRCVTLYKDAGERRLAAVLGGRLGELLVARDVHADVVTPVPASAAAVRRRGFDHAALLARETAQVCGLECRSLLVHQDSGDQRELGRMERRANASEAFVVRSGTHVPDSVLLVDDVLTTGATLDAAARTLKQAGALEVGAGVVARAW